VNSRGDLQSGETLSGRATVTLERGSVTLAFKGVPAEACQNRGEANVGEEISRQLLASVETAVRSGVEVEVREFASRPV
jgi:hypothetical protein